MQTTAAMILGACSFGLFGTAIFEIEEFMHKNYRLAIVLLVLLGMLHTYLKYKGIAINAPGE
jgi:hypothetical protein